MAEPQTLNKVIEPIPVPHPLLNTGEELVQYTPFVFKGNAPEPLPPCEGMNA